MFDEKQPWVQNDWGRGAVQVDEEVVAGFCMNIRCITFFGTLVKCDECNKG